MHELGLAGLEMRRTEATLDNTRQNADVFDGTIQTFPARW